MAIGDIYQIKLDSLWLVSEQMSNVFYYQQSTGSFETSANALASAFISTVINPLVDVTPLHVEYTQATIINYGNPDDSEFRNVGQQGSRGALNDAVMPAFAGFTFRAQPQVPGQPYSYKRFAGVRALDLNQQGQFVPALQTDLDVLSTALGTLAASSGNTYTPCQVTGTKTLGVPLTLSRLLDFEWQWNRFPTTQNTRKDSFYSWTSEE